MYQTADYCNNQVWKQPCTGRLMAMSRWT